MSHATVGSSSDAGFDAADLTTFCRLDELGLVVTGQRLEPERAVLACRVVDPVDSEERWCCRCGCEGVARDTVTRRLAHEPFGWRPTTLVVTIRRYRCSHPPDEDPSKTCRGGPTVETLLYAAVGRLVRACGLHRGQGWVGRPSASSIHR